MSPSPSINLTDEQLAALLEEHTRVKDPNEQTPASPLRYRLGNQEFTAKTPEELQAQLDAAMGQIGQTVQQLQAQAAKPVQQAAPQTQEAAFDKEHYAKLFLENPVDAAEYLDTIRFGMARPSQAIKATISDVGAMEQSLAVQRFINETSDYQATPENFAALAQTMQAYNLPWNYNGMKLAFTQARADGRIAVQADDQYDQQGIADPRFQQQFGRRGTPVLPRTAQVSSSTVDQDLMDRFESMAPDQMKAFLSNLPPGSY